MFSGGPKHELIIDDCLEHKPGTQNVFPVLAFTRACFGVNSFRYAFREVQLLLYASLRKGEKLKLLDLN